MFRSAKRFVPPCVEASIRTVVVSLIGAAALAAGLVLLRQDKQSRTQSVQDVPPGESVPAEIILERLRQAGI